MYRPNGAPLGKLCNKFHNWKSKQTSTLKPENGTIAISNIKHQNEAKHIRALKHESFTFDKTMLHWKACIIKRDLILHFVTNYDEINVICRCEAKNYKLKWLLTKKVQANNCKTKCFKSVLVTTIFTAKESRE